MDTPEQEPDYSNVPVTPDSEIDKWLPRPKKSSLLLRIVKIILSILLVIILLGIIAVGIGYYYANKELKKQGIDVAQLAKEINDKPTPGTVITKAPTNQASESATWSTYANDSAKFSLDFPANLQEKETPQGFGVTTVAFRNLVTNPLETDSADYQLLVFPKTIGKTIGQDFDKYYGMTDNTSTLLGNSSPQRFTKVKNRSINGLRAFDYTLSQESGVEPEIGSYIEIGDKVVVLSTSQENKEQLNHMLSTFKYPL